MDRGQDIPFVYENGVLRPQGPVDLPEGTRGMARIRALSDSEADFHANLTVQELRKRQGTLPIKSMDDLVGDWPEDDSVDEFLQSIRSGRR